MCIVCGGTPPPNKSAGAAAGVVGVVGPTVVGRPQTETETWFLRLSSSHSETTAENQQHNPPENWKEQHLNDEEKKTTTTIVVVFVTTDTT